MKKRRPPVRRVPKPVLAMAAPPLEHPVVTVEKLKGGELNWSVRVPAKSLPKAIDRAVQEAKRLQTELDAWRDERDERRLADYIKRSTPAESGK